MKIKIVTIFLIILLCLSSTEYAVSEILIDSDLISNNIDEKEQTGKIFKLNLSEKATILSNDDDTQETSILKPKIFKLRLSESASIASGDYDQEAISSIKADLERKAILERIWNQERPKISGKSVSNPILTNNQNGLFNIFQRII